MTMISPHTEHSSDTLPVLEMLVMMIMMIMVMKMMMMDDVTFCHTQNTALTHRRGWRRWRVATLQTGRLAQAELARDQTGIINL